MTIVEHSCGELLTNLEHDEIAPSLKDRMDNHSELVQHAYNVFKDAYGTAMKPTVISSIINGEVIKTNPVNIFVDKDVTYEDPLFERKAAFCSKTLYKYQQNAIKKIRELEMRGYAITAHGEKLVSNGWLLSLPIGSGKSLVFQFLAVFYRDVPAHPIITSTDGCNIPDHDPMQWKCYPYYYESCAYYDPANEKPLTEPQSDLRGRVNSVITLKNYTQRKRTVILTHIHLLEQMQEYFETDFKSIFKPADKKVRVRVAYTMLISTIDVDAYDIIVVPATPQNVERLVQLSYDGPFMRVIIDDYTSMSNIDSFRQILASSTIFVSGSGFNRKEEDIPASYYTLKHVPVPMISLVGKPEETFEGIFRDNIATMELMGSRCEFSSYEFVATVDEMVRQRWNKLASDVYPILRTEPKIHNFMSLMFILRYMDRIKSAIKAVEADMIAPPEGSPKLKPERVSHYLAWKEMMRDTIERPAPTERVKGKNGKVSIVKVANSCNPLYVELFDTPAVGSQMGAALVTQQCMSCNKPITDHNGYGMVACCCGAFYCSSCVKSMCTHYIADKTADKSTANSIIHDPDHYYCTCCRQRDPKYYMNINKKKDTNVYSYNLINDFFDTTDLKDHITFDYYFYMFNNGFTPLYQEGKPLNIAHDISQGTISKDCFKRNIIPPLEKILPKDQLGITAIGIINNTLHDLGIMPREKANILFYGCPRYMVNRVKGYFSSIVKENNPATALQIKKANGKVERIQPISVLQLDFKDSVASLIGLHKNIVAIILWCTPERQDEINQIAGRILRISSFNNRLYFYISTNSIGFE